MTTTEQVGIALNILRAFAESIMAAGPQGIPSGHLYAAAMGKMDIHQYESIIRTLKRTGLVREDGSHLLTWTGPEITTKI